MRNVWYTIVRFFKELFAPPESSAFERYLVHQVSYLEGELAREREFFRERERELLERLLPATTNRSESNTSDVKSIGDSRPSWNVRRAELERLSLERAEEARLKKQQDKRWAAHIEELEKNNANLEVEGKDKVYVTAPEIEND